MDNARDDRSGEVPVTRILVTGGAGYVGSHACKALADAGLEPVVFDNLGGGHERAVRWGPLERGDLLDRDAISDVVRRYRPAGAMHFASLINVGDSVHEPGLYWRNNVAGAINLCEALAAGGVGALVFSSTCAVYAPTDAPTLNERLPFGPISPYGNTKRAIEILLGDFEGAHGMRSVILRYFNAAGADAGGGVGEDHDPETHLIPLALAAAAGDRAALGVYGGDYPTPDGTCVRDYVHVTDLADAHVRAIRHLLAGGASDAFNLGAGRGYTVREVIAAIERATGRPVPANDEPRRAGDAIRLVADIAHAREMLGWSPSHSSLDNIVATAWAWYRERFRPAGR